MNLLCYPRSLVAWLVRLVIEEVVLGSMVAGVTRGGGPSTPKSNAFFLFFIFLLLLCSLLNFIHSSTSPNNPTSYAFISHNLSPFFFSLFTLSTTVNNNNMHCQPLMDNNSMFFFSNHHRFKNIKTLLHH